MIVVLHIVVLCQFTLRSYAGNVLPVSYSWSTFTGPVSGEVHEVQPWKEGSSQSSSYAEYGEGESHGGGPDYVAKPDYSFAYGVENPNTGHSHGHSETREGSVVTGEYSVMEPGGVLRHVQYTSDPKNGFRASVRYLQSDGAETPGRDHGYGTAGDDHGDAGSGGGGDGGGEHQTDDDRQRYHHPTQHDDHERFPGPPPAPPHASEYASDDDDDDDDTDHSHRIHEPQYHGPQFPSPSSSPPFGYDGRYNGIDGDGRGGVGGVGAVGSGDGGTADYEDLPSPSAFKFPPSLQSGFPSSLPSGSFFKTDANSDSDDYDDGNEKYEDWDSPSPPSPSSPAPFGQPSSPFGQQTSSPFGQQPSSALGRQTSSPFDQTSSSFTQTASPSTFDGGGQPSAPSPLLNVGQQPSNSPPPRRPPPSNPPSRRLPPPCAPPNRYPSPPRPSLSSSLLTNIVSPYKPAGQSNGDDGKDSGGGGGKGSGSGGGRGRGGLTKPVKKDNDDDDDDDEQFRSLSAEFDMNDDDDDDDDDKKHGGLKNYESADEEDAAKTTKDGDDVKQTQRQRPSTKRRRRPQFSSSLSSSPTPRPRTSPVTVTSLSSSSQPSADLSPSPTIMVIQPTVIDIAVTSSSLYGLYNNH